MRQLIVPLLLAALPAQADTGADLFQRGLGATALVADGAVEVPAAQFACAGCHGEDARGGREGATDFPALIAGAEPRFDRGTLKSALRDGIGADGTPLAAAMPRYRVDDATLDALHTYLSVLARADRAGVTPDALRIAAPADPELRETFSAALADANLQGGAWGRSFELVDAPQSAIVTADEAVMLVDKGLSKGNVADRRAHAAQTAQEIFRVAIACGRAVTRRCMIRRLEASSLSR